MQKLLIHKITIKNSPIFREITFSPSAHFNVFSGASGAGKSVLMESILALFGLRECNAQVLEATLELQGFKEEFKGLIDEGEVILTLTKKDKIRFFLNAQNIPKKKVQELFAPFLKHLSTKMDDATSLENLFLVFDSFCLSKDSKYKVLLDAYKDSFVQFQTAKVALKKIQEEALKVEELKEFVRFEIQKIESLSPKKGEYEELLELKKEISKKEKINESLQEVQEFLNHSPQVSHFLNLIGRENDSILNAFSELEELCAQESERLGELENINPEEILNRLESLGALKHRYGGVEEALEYLEVKKRELTKYENLDSILKDSKEEFQSAKESLIQSANTLQKAREKWVINFNYTLDQSLNSLKMPNAKVLFKPIDEVESYMPFGNQILEITLNTDLKNLSAGEFNRFRLALLLTQSAQEKNQALIILDELDANLSGEESQGVAEALKKLSCNYQVFAISHQPHMPSLADTHFLIQKHSQGSEIILLDQKGRIYEIARMISGNTITKEALEFATKRIEGE
ncbi:AAA family ATPase [uncultured Helicobacter sp.]|uniref:AAA family ATPase n=1 Tax=uncultured Helicobacter sp. TaxID=175537 RepID=UPI002620998F|nr:AAA family ATPase [uncultured Helicobacter sp.]